VVNLVFARFTKSAILYQQMRGRGTRKAKGKPIFTMFDFVGVTDYHGDSDEIAQGGIVMQKPIPKRKTEPRKLLSLDINDHIDPTTREWITVDENGNMVFPEAAEAKAEELGARFEAWLLAREDRHTPEQLRWLRMVGSQLRANAGTLDEFTPGHFSFHPFTLMGGYPEAVRVFGGEDQLDGVLASLNDEIFQEAAATSRSGERSSVSTNNEGSGTCH
jgi:type I restriction enzyme R subunit